MSKTILSSSFQTLTMDILFVAPILKYVFSFIHGYLLNFVMYNFCKLVQHISHSYNLFFICLYSHCAIESCILYTTYEGYQVAIGGFVRIVFDHGNLLPKFLYKLNHI